MKRSRMFQLARKEAEKSPFNVFRHGAVLVRGGKVINSAFNECVHCKLGNKYKNHPGISTRHAELSVILGIDKKVTTGADVYVVRINPSGNLKNSRPCEMCMGVMKFVGVRRVFYSISNNEYGVLKICNLK